jgi:superfamily I DNA and/or RNA helicase
VNSKRRILLCAPSNAAVDVLVRRLIREVNVSSTRDRFDRPTSQGIKIVRLGRISAIHPDVKPFGLKSLTDQKISQEAASLQNQAMTSLGVELSSIERNLEEVEKRILSLKRSFTYNRQNQVIACHLVLFPLQILLIIYFSCMLI